MELNDRPTPNLAGAAAPPGLPCPDLDELAPADAYDPVIEAYKKDIDRTLLIENLRLTVSERLAKFQSFMDALGEMRGAALPPDLRERLFGKR